MNYENVESNIRVVKCEYCPTEVVNPPKSKRLVVCANCAHYAKYGESLFATQQRKLKEAQQRAKERLKNKPPQYKPVKKIPFFSEKGKERHTAISKVKNEIRQDIENRFCLGCNRGDVGLDCSHILSVKHRSDLETDKDNINKLCRTCHQNWESGNIELMINLKCFEKDMVYIHEKDETRFNKILFKLLDFIEANPQDKKAVQILNRLEKIETAE